MSYKITKGKIEKPLLILLYGPDKVGKSTFAAAAPDPIFIQIEEGANQLEVAKMERPSNYREVREQIAQVAADKDYKTIVIDSLDWLEEMVFEQVCAEYTGMPKAISEIPFGKGYPLAQAKWREFLTCLNEARDAGKNIILIAHSILRRFEDPTLPQGYDRFQLKLHEGSTTSKTPPTAALFNEYVDCILFANFEVYPNADDPRRAYGDGTRVLYTERRPAFDAGNRLGLPFKLPLDWGTFEAEANPKKGEAEAKLRETILGMLPKVKDEKVRKSAEEALPKKKSLGELSAMKTKLEAFIV